MNKTRKFISVLMTLSIITVVLAGCGQNESAATKLSDRAVIQDKEFGGVYIDITIDEFNDMGFEFGDGVDITFSNGYELKNIPYYNGYYTQPGDALLVGYPGYPHIEAAICNGPSLWKELGLVEGDFAEITLVKKGEYLNIQEARDIHYQDDRSRYPDDATFANFRSVKAGNIRENTLYRSASPCDNQHNRAPYTDDLAEEAGIDLILNLADNDEKINGYKEKSDFDSPYFWSLYTEGNVIPIALSANYGADDFREKLANGLREIIKKDGSILIHCTEGKDRTGFVCMLLEALCGAGYEEIENDYMITYENYYGITTETDKDKYDTLVDEVMIPMIRVFADDKNVDVKKADLSPYAEKYLKQSGLTEEEIGKIKERFGPPGRG